MSDVTLPKKAPYTRWVIFDNMEPHPEIERELDLKRAQAIADGWHAALVGTLLLSVKPNGKLWILDGMHRWKAAQLSGRGKQTAECHTFSGLSIQQEAELFQGRNNTKRLSPVDLFRAAVIKEDPEAVEVNAAIEKAGWKVGSHGERSFAAIAAIMRIYRNTHGEVPGPVAVARALHTSAAAWTVCREASSAIIIEGLGLLHLQYGDALKDDDLIKRLAKIGTPGTMVGRARAYAEIRSRTKAMAFALVTLDLYNKKPRRYPLPAWPE